MFAQIKRNGFIWFYRSPNAQTIHHLDALDPIEPVGFTDDRDQIGVRLNRKHLTWVSRDLRRAGRHHAHTSAQLKHTVARPHEFAQQLNLGRFIAIAPDHMRHSVRDHLFYVRNLDLMGFKNLGVVQVAHVLPFMRLKRVIILGP